MPRQPRYLDVAAARVYKRTRQRIFRHACFACLNTAWAQARRLNRRALALRSGSRTRGERGTDEEGPHPSFMSSLLRASGCC